MQEESPEQAKGNDEIADMTPNTNENSKRITGERFLKLGAYFVKPEKKVVHKLSKVNRFFM